MSKKINFATVTPATQTVLSGFFHAVYRAAELSAEKREKSESLDAAIAEAKTALENNPCADTITAYNAALHNKQAVIKSIEESVKALRHYKEDAYKLIPASMYDSYVAMAEKVNTTTRAAFNKDIKDCLESMGITVTTETQLNNTAETLRTWNGGLVKAGTKTVLNKGTLSSVKSKLQFNDLFIRSLIDLFVSKNLCTYKAEAAGKYALEWTILYPAK